jgi:HK97 family phage major capsid protein
MDITKDELLQSVRDVVKEVVGDTATLKKDLVAEEKTEEKDLNAKFKTFGDFLSSVARIRRFGEFDNRLVYKNERGDLVKPEVNGRGKATLVEGTDSAGGFLVPEEYRADLQSVGIEQAIVRRANPFVVPMRNDTLSYPIVNDTTHASSVHGGVIAYWTKEGAVGTESEPTFGLLKLTAHKLSGYTKVSNELLADSAVALEPLLRRQFGEAWAWFEDLAFLRGSGSGQPLGVYNAACMVSVTRQDTDEVFIKDVINLYSRMLPGSRDRAVWILNHEVLPQLMWSHSANTSTNAYGAPQVFMPNLVDPLAKTILGRPYFVTEKLPGLGDAGDLMFCDFGSYLIGERSPITIDMSDQVYWSTDYIAYKFTERIDGQPTMTSALTPYGSQDTLSAFVMLGAAS